MLLENRNRRRMLAIKGIGPAVSGALAMLVK
jgi:hypothetical protein